MKKIIMIITAVIVMAGITTRVAAQVTLTGNTAGAELVVALTITNSTAMHFGVISTPAANGGSVAMATNSSRVPTGTGVAIIASGTATTAAKFDVTGTAGDAYSFTLPASILVSTGAGGTTSDMTINAFRVKVDGAAEVAYASMGTCTLTSGASSILVGGTITIQTAQVLGVYAGTYTVIVDYL